MLDAGVAVGVATTTGAAVGITVVSEVATGVGLVEIVQAASAAAYAASRTVRNLKASLSTLFATYMRSVGKWFPAQKTHGAKSVHGSTAP